MQGGNIPPTQLQADVSTPPSSFFRVLLEDLQAGAMEDGADYELFASQMKTSAALVEALMKPDRSTFIQKYTQPVISGILNPLVRELKGKL